LDEKKSRTLLLKEKVLGLVKKFTKSGVATESLKEFSGKTLLRVAKTRWNSFYYVCDRLLAIREHVMTICNSKDWPITFSWADVTTMHQLLKPFAEVRFHFIFLEFSISRNLL
jgi:hypothetical protein